MSPKIILTLINIANGQNWLLKTCQQDLLTSKSILFFSNLQRLPQKFLQAKSTRFVKLSTLITMTSEMSTIDMYPNWFLEVMNWIRLVIWFLCIWIYLFFSILKAQFKILSRSYLKIMSVFSSSYKCEMSFSAMNFIMNQYRSSLTQNHLRDCLIVSLSSFEISFTSVVKQLQCQISHWSVLLFFWV